VFKYCYAGALRRARPLTGSSLPSARRTLIVLLFPYREIYTHRILQRDPPLTYRGIGLRGIARSMVERWCFESPKPRWKSTLTLPLPCRDFSYRDFATRDIKQMDLPNPEPRCVDTPMHTWVDYSCPVTSIGISDFAGSRILMPNVSGLYFP
jgi:hypothetical protein